MVVGDALARVRMRDSQVKEQKLVIVMRLDLPEAWRVRVDVVVVAAVGTDGQTVMAVAIGTVNVKKERKANLLFLCLSPPHTQTTRPGTNASA